MVCLKIQKQMIYLVKCSVNACISDGSYEHKFKKVKVSCVHVFWPNVKQKEIYLYA